MKSTPHIAVLDDEVDITQLLANYLPAHGFRVSQTHDGDGLIRLMERDPADLVLLDLGLPGEDGLSVARRMRGQWQAGLIIVTGRGDAVDKIVGLEVGADDYVTKPFDLRELVARIKAVLRRMTTPAPSTPAPGNSRALCFAGWRLDIDARSLRDPQGLEVALTHGEFELLSSFARHPGRVLSRDFLLEHTRGREAAPFDRTIDVQVGRLRKKLQSPGGSTEIIKSVRGAGYILIPPVSHD
ncbi:response regulator [Hydrogenophaga sp.]|uniref:response regulator n=1 Tax=Hydrogenophaga sp. TaxID=1904254 RepID=UPI003D09CB23